MSTIVDFTTPAQAVGAMIDAGAVFMIRRRPDALGLSFTYTVAEGGDIDLCRQILAAVKEKPPAFFQAFRAAVQEATRISKTIKGVSTPLTPGTHKLRRNRGVA